MGPKFWGMTQIGWYGHHSYRIVEESPHQFENEDEHTHDPENQIMYLWLGSNENVLKVRKHKNIYIYMLFYTKNHMW